MKYSIRGSRVCQLIYLVVLVFKALLSLFIRGAWIEISSHYRISGSLSRSSYEESGLNAQDPEKSSPNKESFSCYNKWIKHNTVKYCWCLLKTIKRIATESLLKFTIWLGIIFLNQPNVKEKGELTMNENKDINIEKKNVTRNEQPGLVGSTFIKYSAYIIILLIILYFVITYILPRL